MLNVWVFFTQKTLFFYNRVVYITITYMLISDITFEIFMHGKRLINGVFRFLLQHLYHLVVQIFMFQNLHKFWSTVRTTNTNSSANTNKFSCTYNAFWDYFPWNWISCQQSGWQVIPTWVSAVLTKEPDRTDSGCKGVDHSQTTRRQQVVEVYTQWIDNIFGGTRKWFFKNVEWSYSA